MPSRICFATIIVPNTCKWFTWQINFTSEICVDDTSLFSKAINRKNLRLNLIKIWNWLANGHISGKCYLILILPNKIQKFDSHINISHESLTFNNNKTQSAPAQKHLGLILDSKLDFNQHIDDKINKCNKSLGLWEDFQWYSLEKAY